jgi:hypothetical protein
MSSYRYQTPTPRTFNVLPAGDYMAVITEAEEPYEKNSKQILKTTLTIQPSGHTVFYYAWSGQTAAGEYRDNIGELLLAANRAPAVGEEPKWAKLKGAKVKVRLKVEPDQNGEERNVIHWVYAPKKAGKPSGGGQSVSTDEFLKAREKGMQASGGGEPEQDDLPYACDRG